jgi:7-cyano-7-deazaguanine synthase
MEKAIVVCSGGLDSCVTAYYVKNKLKFKDIFLLFFDYGQRARIEERKCAKSCAIKIGANFLEIRLDIKDLLSGDLINSKAANKIKRKDLKDTKNESDKWYVPHRNLIFLSYALAIAETRKIRNIFVGFKSEGVESYPDTTKGFVKQLNKLESEFGAGIHISAPMIDRDKEDIVSLGEEMGLNFGETISCYAPKRGMHCGTCLSCRLRQESFYWANIRDPTEYLERMKDFASAN